MVVSYLEVFALTRLNLSEISNLMRSQYDMDKWGILLLINVHLRTIKIHDLLGARRRQNQGKEIY
jgi:hypothetical protein